MNPRIAILGLGALLTLAACGSPYETLEVQRIAGDAQASLSDGAMEVTEGRVVVFEAKPIAASSHRDFDALDTLQLRATDPDVATVARGLATNTWMLIGGRAGETDLQVRVNGELEEIISVRVHPQTEASR
jgi:hypothetical protein